MPISKTGRELEINVKALKLYKNIKRSRKESVGPSSKRMAEYAKIVSERSVELNLIEVKSIEHNRNDSSGTRKHYRI